MIAAYRQMPHRTGTGTLGRAGLKDDFGAARGSPAAFPSAQSDAIAWL